MADIEHVKYIQEQEGYRFTIEHLGGSMSKNDRIKRLIPLFEKSRFYLPRQLFFVNVKGEVEDFTAQFIKDEYSEFPISTHDDILDCMARITDEAMSVKFPQGNSSVSGNSWQEIERQKNWHPLDRLDGERTNRTDEKINVSGGLSWKDAMRIK